MERRSLEVAVRRALEAARRPSPGDRLIVALSGGADSVALTDVLATLAKRLGFRLVAAHLDHGLRPASAEDAAFCAALCRDLGIELRVGRADVRARARREIGRASCRERVYDDV